MLNDSVMTVRNLINELIDELCDTAMHPDRLGAVVQDERSGDEFAIRDVQILGEKLAIVIDEKPGAHVLIRRFTRMCA